MSLYIFDKDGTLVATKKTWLRLNRPVLRPEDQVLKPGVFEKLAELRKAGHTLVIASNQHAVAKGWITHAQAEEMMKNCIEKVGGVSAWRICAYEKNAPRRLDGRPNPYRKETTCEKPEPGMLLDLMEALGFPPSETVAIGNSWKDRKAAQAAGVRFVKAEAFFKPPKPDNK